jgi:hypothetical protein
MDIVDLSVPPIEFTVSPLDVRDFTTGQLPSVVVPRAGSEIWMVREKAVDITGADNDSCWSTAEKGDFVHIPALPMLALTAGHAIAAAFQQGIAFHRLVGKVHQNIREDICVRRIHIVLVQGNIQEADQGNGMKLARFFLGMAAVVKGPTG